MAADHDPQLLKGVLSLLLLQLLAEQESYGYEVVQRLHALGLTGGLEGTVYPALHRLEEAGLLSSTWMTPPGGRRRRMYSLTKAGSVALAERRKAWGRFSHAVDTLLGGGRAWPA